MAYIDSFGNVISDITPTDLKSLQEVTKRTDIAIQVGATTIKGLKTHYGQGSSESPEALISSNGHLEVFLKEGQAANHLGVKVGDPIQVS